MSKRTSLSLKTFVSVTFLLLVATAILVACGSSSSGTATASSSRSTSSSSNNNSAFRIQRSVWTGRRGSIRHGRQRVHVELHTVDISGSEGDRRRGVLYDIPEGDELDLGECHYNRRKRPRTWDDDQRNDHHGHAGHRATDWRRRICDFLGGRGGPLPARCTDHVKAGRSDPGELQSGVGDDRQRNDRE